MGVAWMDKKLWYQKCRAVVSLQCHDKQLTTSDSAMRVLA